MVTQSALWPLMSSWFKKDDVIIAEMGTSLFGLLDVALPEGATFVSQVRGRLSLLLRRR